MVLNKLYLIAITILIQAVVTGAQEYDIAYNLNTTNPTIIWHNLMAM